MSSSTKESLYLAQMLLARLYISNLLLFIVAYLMKFFSAREYFFGSVPALPVAIILDNFGMYRYPLPLPITEASLSSSIQLFFQGKLPVCHLCMMHHPIR
jgi:hypothetical protein